MKPLHDMLLLCTLEAVKKFTGNKRSYEALNVTENKTRQSLE